MPAPTRTPREAWIDAGLSALAAGGPDAVRVDPLAKGLGVTRGGFYWHFDSRDAFLDELLDTWERRSIDEVVQRVEAEGGDPRERVRRAGMETFSKLLLPIDLAVRDWARRDAKVAGRLQRVDDRRMDYLRTQVSSFCSDADDVEARCTLAFCLAIGQHFIGTGSSRRARAVAIERAMTFLLA
ncbi:MAG: TetR/AcrR family transcriptional regulator [Ilumatobacteraceae bacterium]